MRKERWAFSEWENDFPFTCNTHDELIAHIPDCEEGIIVYRNGEVSNRRADGTAGVSANIAELADAEDTLYHPTSNEYTDRWADVEVDNDGSLLHILEQTT